MAFHLLSSCLLKTQLFNLGNLGYMSVKDENFPRAQGVFLGGRVGRRPPAQWGAVL